MARFRSALLLIACGAFHVCTGQVQSLSFNPIASRGSTALDRVIMISTSPDLLHIYDPSTTNDITVSLPKPPLGLAVSPDGLHAAVTHDGLLSWIDLSAGSIIKTIAITGQATTVFMSNTYAMYEVAGNGYTGGLTGVNLLTGTAVTAPGLSYYYATNGVFDATQQYMYLSQDGTSPDDMEKAAIVNGQLTSAAATGGSGGWPYHGDYPDCGPYYLSVDGTRIYTSCGTVVHAATAPTLDMYYLRTLPAASFPLAGLSESASSKLLAVIPSAYSYVTPTPTAPDVQVQLFQTDYLLPAGNIALLPVAIPSGSYAAHGKAVFFSRDASRLFVVAQADSTSNLTNPYVVEVIPLASSPSCSVTFNSTPLQVSAGGSYGSLALQAAPSCLYTAISNSPWITLSAGAYGSGNGTLQWIVRPNSSTQSRSGTITVNGQIYTIQQTGAPSTLPNPAPLSFNIVDSDYSSSLNRIVMVSASPNEMHIYDPAAQTDTVVPLVLPPFAVSVAPDGLHAAVGHDGWISYVDLQATTVQTFQIVTDVHHVLLAGNGYIYGFPQRDWSDIYSLQISTGTVTGTSAIYEGRVPRLEPNGNYFYAIGDQWFSKWNITKGVAVSIVDSPGGGISANNLWLHQDGTQIIGGTARVNTFETPGNIIY